MVATPDGDIYEESMSRHDPDVNGLWLVPSGGGIPRGLPAARHNWGANRRPALTDELKAEYIEAGIAEPALQHGPDTPGAVAAKAALALLRPVVDVGRPAGGGPPGVHLGAGGGAPGAMAPGAGAAATAQRWRVVRAASGPSFGEVVDPAAVVFYQGPLGIAVVGGVTVAVELVADDVLDTWKKDLRPLDARILAVAQLPGGKRGRRFTEAISLLAEEPCTDRPAAGPRTAMWCLQFLAKRGQGPLEHHYTWKQLSKLQVHDYGVEFHEAVMRIVELAVTYDQVDGSNLAALEVALRRAQIIEYYHMQRLRDGENSLPGSTRLTMDEVTAFSGVRRQDDNLMLCPSLLVHAKDEVGEVMEINKSMRKHREEIRLQRGNNRDQPNKKKKDGDEG